jgi:hypothetical protein
VPLLSPAEGFMIYFWDRPDLASDGLSILLDGKDVGEYCTGFALESGEVELLKVRPDAPDGYVDPETLEVAKEVRAGRLEIHLKRVPARVIWPEAASPREDIGGWTYSRPMLEGAGRNLMTILAPYRRPGEEPSDTLERLLGLDRPGVPS